MYYDIHTGFMLIYISCIGPTSGLNSSVNTIFEKVIAAAKVTKIRSARTREEFSNILYENQARTGMALWVENLNSYDVFDVRVMSRCIRSVNSLISINYSLLLMYLSGRTQITVGTKYTTHLMLMVER